MKLKRLTALLLALGMTLALTACGGDQTENPGVPGTTDTNSPSVVQPGNTAVQEGVVPGTTLNFRLPVDVEGLLPWMSPRAANIYVQTYDTLMQPYRGDWNDLRGLLATEWTMSEDGMTWVFQITDQARFTNGKPLTAQTMVDCWTYTKQYQPGLFVGIDTIEASGEYELTFHMSFPNPGLLANFANVYSGICDPELVAQYGSESDEAAIGTGAYYVENKTTGSVTTLKANTEYWNKEQMPHIETLNYWYIPDNNTALAALQSGEIDIIDSNDYNTYDVAVNYPGMDGIIVYDQVRSLYINAQSPQLQDVRVRQALQCLIDPEELNLAQCGGYGSVDHSFVRHTCGSYQKGNYTYDVERGLALLAEANVDPSTLTLQMISNTDLTGAAENIQAQLNEVGITVDITTYDVATAEATINAGNFDLGFYRVDTDVASGLIMAQTWLKSDGVKPVMWADSAISAEIDGMIAEAEAAISMEEQNAIIKELQTYIIDEAALVIPGVTPGRFYIYNADKLQDVVVDNSTCRCDWRYTSVK